MSGETAQPHILVLEVIYLTNVGEALTHDNWIYLILLESHIVISGIDQLGLGGLFQASAQYPP